jgi:hypothetical protein
MEARYNILFAGELLEGRDMAEVRAALAKLFNADDATLDKLFSGKAQIIKRDCDKPTALKYKQAMERAGAKPVIKSAGEAAVEPDPQPTLSAAERIAALAAAPDEDGYRSNREEEVAATDNTSVADDGSVDLAPAGADVLRPEERPQPVTAEIDTSSLGMDETAQRLSEESPPPPPAPDTSHLDMGEVGDTIPNLDTGAPPVNPDTSAIKLAPEGTDLSDCAPKTPQPPAVDLSAMELAPTGSDVIEDQYRKREQPKAPNTDHISLEE